MDPSVISKIKMQPLHFIASVLVILGALNWGLTVFKMNAVDSVAGYHYNKFIYGIIGLAGIYLAVCKVMWLTGNKMPMHA